MIEETYSGLFTFIKNEFSIIKEETYHTFVYGHYIKYNDVIYLYHINENYYNKIKEYADKTSNVILTSEIFQFHIQLNDSVFIYKNHIYNINNMSIELKQQILDDLINVQEFSAKYNFFDYDYRILLLTNNIRKCKFEFIEKL